MSAITRILTAVAGACAALFAGSGTSHAELDSGSPISTVCRLKRHRISRGTSAPRRGESGIDAGESFYSYKTVHN